VNTQREELAKHGIDHDKYEVFLSDANSIDDESTGIMVREVATGRQAEDTVGYSRRQMAEDGNTVYIDTIIKLVKELETK
jgi:hypothetical protein